MNDPDGLPPAEDADAEIASRADRLRQAVKNAGGATSVARQLGMPIQTLNNYLAARDMKASAMISLAEHTGVSIEWLATGRGPMHTSSFLASSFFDGDLMKAPAHFWGLLVTIRSCQEWFEHSGVVPSLQDVLEWIVDPYSKAMKLPDIKVEFKTPTQRHHLD